MWLTLFLTRYVTYTRHRFPYETRGPTNHMTNAILKSGQGPVFKCLVIQSPL